MIKDILKELTNKIIRYTVRDTTWIENHIITQVNDESISFYWKNTDSDILVPIFIYYNNIGNLPTENTIKQVIHEISFK